LLEFASFQHHAQRYAWSSESSRQKCVIQKPS
jgi:hypothetical protein